MNKNKYVFAQLFELLDRNNFNYLTRKYQPDRYIKSFTCWNQLLAMMFGQLAKSESLRDIILAIEAHWTLTIAELYRNRWKVELFFKWLKQHLKIKKFWGISENAVRVQIYCTIITYCLVVIMKHDMQSDRSPYEILQITGISLTDKTPLRDLFDKSNFNNFKELLDHNEPNLFNF